MSRVFLQRTSVTPENQYADREYSRMVSIAQSDSVHRHDVADSAEEADLIFFIGSETTHMRSLVSHPLYRRFQDRCFVFYAGDQVFPFLPGFYPSIERRCYRNSQTRSVPYLRVIEEQFEEANHDIARRYLFSFRGNVSTAPLRKRILAIQSENAKLVDTGASSYSSNNRKEYIADAELSDFIICPRGGGPSSFRIFESLKMGRAPVIVSDQWVEPVGPDWSEFSVRVLERDIEAIPTVLQKVKANAKEMGIAARQAWDKFFSPDVYFDYLVQQALAMQQSRSWRDIGQSIWSRRVLANPRNFRRFVLSRLRTTKTKSAPPQGQSDQ